MHDKFTTMTPALYEYLVAHNPAPDAVLRELAAETAALGRISIMQVAVEQGVFLTFLARLLGARRAVEVGTFTGYSAISIARGLAADGRLLCCDLNEAWAGIARRYFVHAGATQRGTLRVDSSARRAGRGGVGVGGAGGPSRLPLGRRSTNVSYREVALGAVEGRREGPPAPPTGSRVSTAARWRGAPRPAPGSASGRR